MKTKKVLLIGIISLINFACKDNSSELKKKDSNSLIQTDKKVEMVEKKFYGKNLINGVWAEKKDENALFYIKNDSIYYTEHQDTPFFIDLTNNELVIHFDNYISKSEILKLTNDSLIYKADSEIVKLYKRK